VRSGAREPRLLNDRTKSQICEHDSDNDECAGDSGSTGQLSDPGSGDSSKLNTGKGGSGAASEEEEGEGDRAMREGEREEDELDRVAVCAKCSGFVLVTFYCLEMRK